LAGSSAPAEFAPRRLGDRDVFPIALGTASWSLIDLRRRGQRVTEQSERRAIAAIHAALDCGVRLFDTARAYTTPNHGGHSEELLARALRSHPAGAEALVATKAGHERVGIRFPEDFPVDTHPSTIRRHVHASLEFLQQDTLWLIHLHWPPDEGSLKGTMQVFAELLDEGLVRNVGVCNASLQQVKEAQSVVPLVSVQNHFSPFDDQDRPTVEYCAENAIAYLAYSPLGGSGTGHSRTLASAFPHAEHEAEDRRVSIQTLALAWLLAQSPTLIPITGASSPSTVRSSAEAATVSLTPVEAETVGFSRRNLVRR
jgi:aryl-alcohol dehydrogenase-like predicted oxidoreductase